MPSTTLLAAAAGAVAAVVVVPAALVGAIFVSTSSAAVVAGNCATDGGPGGGAQPVATAAGTPAWTGEQMSIAQTIVTVAEQRSLPERAAVIAVATGIVESRLRNLTNGPLDALGVFQQRPSQGWGTPEQILNPTYAANTFYTHLAAIPNWASLPPGEAEQDVQRSDRPDLYGPAEPQAAALVTKFWSGPGNGLPPDQPVDPAHGGCPDNGGSDVPLNPAPGKLPPDFQLPTDPQARAAVAFALAQVGKPYVWGATGPSAFDCSGLMLAAWAHAGIALSRTTFTQVHEGTPVSSISQAQPGDLMFIPGSDGTAQNPGHVGMFVGFATIVDAYDTDKGVIIESLSAWTSKIVAIRHIPTSGSGGGNGPRT